MDEKTVFQTDTAGHFIGVTVADESPMEPGVFLMPRGCVDAQPPSLILHTDEAGAVIAWTGEWPDDKWPRFIKSTGWELIQRPAAAKQAEDNTKPAEDPVAKLQAFLSANPDVAALVSPAPPAAA